LLMLLSVRFYNTLQSDFALFSWDSEFVLALFLIISTLINGFAFASIYLMRRGDHRLRMVSKLQEVFANQQGDSHNTNNGASFSIAEEEYHAVARIEREQIIRNRMKSIKSTNKEKTSVNYVISKGRDVRQMQSRLDSNSRKLIDEKIMTLPSEATPDKTEKNNLSKSYYANVPDTTFEIEYKIDRQRARILIEGLRDLRNVENLRGG
jgi:hypothetical protein